MDYFTEEDENYHISCPFKSLLRNLAPVKCINILRHAKIFGIKTHGSELLYTSTKWLFMHLPHESSLIIQLQIYKQIHRFFNVYMRHLPSFVSFHDLVHVRILAGPIQIFVGAIKIKFHFLVCYSHRPLLDNADIYASTLILCTSLYYNLIDTKTGTMVHLLLFYHSSQLYGQKHWYQCYTTLY